MSRGTLQKVVFVLGVGFIIAGIWARWLLEDRLLQTGSVLIGVAMLLETDYGV